MHSPLALAFLQVAIDVVAQANIHPTKRAYFALVFESGARPKVVMRGTLIARLTAAGLDEQARKAARRTRTHEILAWFTTDEESGLLALPIAKPPSAAIDLPCDDTLRSLMEATP